MEGHSSASWLSAVKHILRNVHNKTPHNFINKYQNRHCTYICFTSKAVYLLIQWVEILTILKETQVTTDIQKKSTHFLLRYLLTAEDGLVWYQKGWDSLVCIWSPSITVTI